MKKILSVFAAAMCFCALASAQQMPPIPVDENVRIGHLDNGLTYYIRHNEEPKGQANFYIAQKVGSILEDEDQRGLAHFLEHMCFNGTQKFPGNNIVKYCESIGVKFGADLNAYTSIDETVYNIDNVPVEKVPSAIDSCLWILHDWADGLLLTDEDIDGERGVIHEEWRSRLNATMRIYEKILPILYPDNKYGVRMPIGTMEVVDNFPYKVLRDYYEKWYRPDQQGIVVVGDIDVDQVEGKIKDIFGTIAKPENPAERYYVQIPDNQETIVALATDKEQPYSIAYLFWKHDPIPNEMKGDMSYLIYQYAIEMACSMLNERLYDLTQLPEPPFSQAFVSEDDYFIAKTKKSIAGAAVFGDGQLESAVSTLYREMLRAYRNGFTASEYDRARSQFLADEESAYNSREKKKSTVYCSEYVRHFIDNEPIPGIENRYALAQQLAPNIPVEAINQMFSSIVKEGSNLVISLMLPEKDGITYPSEDEVRKLLNDIAAEEINAFEDKVSDEPLIAELPTPGKVKKVKDAQLGYKLYTLSNGAQVYIKNTDFNKDQINFSAFSKGGFSLYPAQSDIINIKGISTFTEGGLGKFSQTELSKVLAGKKVSCNAYIDSYEEGVYGNSTPKDFETLMQLIYLTFTDRRYDKDAFVSWQNKNKAILANQEAQPLMAFQDTAMAVFYHRNPYSERLKSNQVDLIDYDRIMQIANERFANAGDFVFVFTGAIDEETAIPMIEQYIGSLPGKGKKEKAKNIGMSFAKGYNQNVFTKEMEIPMAAIAYIETANEKYNLKNILSTDIAQQILSIVYTEEIREKEGGTYGVSTAGAMTDFPEKQSYVQIVYQTDPDKYEHLNFRIEEIMTDFAKNGPSDENLAKVKEYMTKKYQENQRENSYFARTIKTFLMEGVDRNTDYEKVLDSITKEDVRKIVADMLAQGNVSKVVMCGTPKAK